ncbi:MAG: phosphate ABC transporter substrate-binding protein [Ezakiella sp.]|nr:phosphate ABC transporter substrate-binding protein [Ezakiella sp.]MDD7761266.1 phosphate ABC transporter substrate-binding protein [Bacillota bacterium]MDY3947563.1 phosphate ABC transporter substrate-binding protein [Ezakiella sp.]
MKRLFVVIMAVAMVFVGCTKKSDFSGELSFAGSSTLAPVISAVADDFKSNANSWRDIDAKFADKEIVVNVSTGGSGAGIKAIQENTANFGMVARELKDGEKEIKDLIVDKIGIDALTISINPENPASAIFDNLSSDEIRKIFSGEYKTWNELDESLPDEEIVVVIRDLGGGAHEVFQNAIMGETAVREDAIQAPSMGALVQKIIENKNAIGYASYGVSKQNEGKLFPIKVDGVEASEDTILDGSYIISRPLLVCHIGELDSEAQYFMDYIKSDKGEQILNDLGFVPVK